MSKLQKRQGILKTWRESVGFVGNLHTFSPCRPRTTLTLALFPECHDLMKSWGLVGWVVSVVYRLGRIVLLFWSFSQQKKEELWFLKVSSTSFLGWESGWVLIFEPFGPKANDFVWICLDIRWVFNILGWWFPSRCDLKISEKPGPEKDGTGWFKYGSYPWSFNKWNPGNGGFWQRKSVLEDIIFGFPSETLGG